MEIRIIVATLVAGFDVTLGERDLAPPVRRNLTMGPKGGVPLRLNRRSLSPQ